MLNTGHSEDYFGDYRDDWWNRDFLELMARRLNLGDCRSLLDVGCGQCHWSRLLVDLVNRPAKIHAVDADPKWASGSKDLRRYFESRGASIEFRQGNAESLPYDDNSFELVTGQTVLIHLPNPAAAVREMHRVVKPGGLVLCVEPNNLAGSLVKSSVASERSVAEIVADVEYALLCERGKIALGKGDSSFGDLLPGTFAATGFHDIRTYLSDKAVPLYPLYDTPEQQAILDNVSEWRASESGPYDWAEQQQYLKALGLAYDSAIEKKKRRAHAAMARLREAVDSGRYHSGGGCLMYLVSGRKSEP